MKFKKARDEESAISAARRAVEVVYVNVQRDLQIVGDPAWVSLTVPGPAPMSLHVWQGSPIPRGYVVVNHAMTVAMAYNALNSWIVSVHWEGGQDAEEAAVPDPRPPMVGVGGHASGRSGR